MRSRSSKTIHQALATLQCRDGARRVFTDQADIACTKRERGRGQRCRGNNDRRAFSCTLLLVSSAVPHGMCGTPRNNLKERIF